MDVHQHPIDERTTRSRSPAHTAEEDRPPPEPGAPLEATAPSAGEGPADPGPPDDPENLNRLAKIVLALIPALTVALAAVGGATGGLARLFRDQTITARAAIGLIFLSFLLAVIARPRGTVPGRSARMPAARLRVRATLLLASGVALLVGIALAFDAQITVMGYGEAPVVAGSVTPTSSGDTLDAHVVAHGVKSSSRIVVFAFESSDQKGDVHSNKVPLYYSKTGPDPDGQVDVHVAATVPASDLQQFPYLFVTAVLGEEQRDCDGVLIEGKGAPQPDATACLTLERPGATTTPQASAAAASTAGTWSAPTVITVLGTVQWTRTGVVLGKGQRFVVNATGQVSFIQGAPRVGPDGDTQPHPNVCVLPGPDHHAALIGRIVGAVAQAPFLVGSDFTGVAGDAGQLQLGINDTGVDNNGGAFTASIQVAT